MDQSHSNKHCQQMQLKRGLNIAIMRNTLTRHLATKGGKCDDTHQYCSNTNGCFYPRKPVTSKKPACVESEREVNKVNGRLTETVKGYTHCDYLLLTHRLSATLGDKSHALRPPEAWNASGGLRRMRRRLSRPARPRHGRADAAERRQSGSPPPRPRRSRCRS